MVFNDDKCINQIFFKDKEISKVYFKDQLVFVRPKDGKLKLVKKVRFGTGINTKLLTDAVGQKYGGGFRELKFFEEITQSYLTLKDKNY